MRSTLRAVAVASSAALLVTGVTSLAGLASSAGASGAAQFQVHPAFGRPGSTVTLTGNDFSSETGVTFNGSPSASVTKVSNHKLTAVVPPTATSGEVDVQEGVSTLTGPAFTVQQLTAATSTLSKSAVTYSHTLLVTGYETVAGTGRPIAHQLAALQRRTGSGKWVHAKGIHAAKTDKHGRVQWTIKPRANSDYRVYFRSSHTYVGKASAAHAVQVRPRLHLRSLHTVSELSTTHIRGSVHPRVGGVVYLQRFINGKWQRVRHTNVVDGRFSFGISPSAIGRLKYRVVRHHDSSHVATTSRTLKLQVVHRTLSLGSSGRDVLALQKRLHKLHYDIGPRNGSYGYDTLHAVTAFEKVNGLSKDGQTGPKVWSKLNHPKRVHLRHPDPSESLAVEVNLAKQVLILAKNGKVWRILDTSTAGGYYFTNSEGESEKAVTPTGHFTIQYKLTGWHKSDLGELYYPSYFTNTGYAIHGEGNGNSSGNVPPYPNSHGCVRITNNAVLRYFNKLVVGTSVWIYG
jgi:peptidoglycan hydrolase-like protein with peptidoglycan-binding domain